MRRVLLLAALAAGMLAGGCSFDIALVEQPAVDRCLAAAGANPQPFEATGAAPSLLRRLGQSEGRTGAVALAGPGARADQASAFLFYFDGVERAERVEREIIGRGPAGPAEASTRRQNVIVVYGDGYGRPVTPQDRRTLDRCFDRAIEEASE